MKAMVLTGIRQMEPAEVPDPVLTQPTDVLLKVEVVGVCGSDVHYYTTGRIGSQVVRYPYRVGHEFSATVLETGSQVRGLKRGDRVAVDPAMSCGTCDQCRAGRLHTCRTLRFLGCPGQAEGCLSERVVMPRECCFPVPADMTLEQAAAIEPLSIGIYAAGFAAPLRGQRIGILGFGPIGLSILLPALAGGVDRVYVTDRVPERLTIAQRTGATWTGNPDRGNVLQDIRTREPLLLDTVFECCGQQSALDTAVELLKPGGKLVLVGIPEVDRITFPIDLLRRKELCIQNIRRQNECTQKAIDQVASGKIDLDGMVTHRFSFAESKAAFDLVEQYADGVMKALIVL